MPLTSIRPAAAPADHHVQDLSLAAWGRKEMHIAETEMPGLMAIREEYAETQPLKGARIAGSLHMTIQTAVLIETLTALGAEVRWASCNIFSTQDHAAAAIAAAGMPVFAYKGETLEEYWDYTHRIFEWRDGGTANMILDDGGDATLLVHLGIRGRDRTPPSSRNPTSEEEQYPLRRDQEAPRRAARLVLQDRGQHQGRHRGDHHRRAPPLPDAREGHGSSSPPSTSTTRSPSRSSTTSTAAASRWWTASSAPPTSWWPARSRSSAATARSARAAPRRCAGLQAQVWVTEIDPICALQAAMEGYRVVTMDYAADKADIFVTTTGNINVITHDHMKRMKNNAIVCNIGHFDNEIDVAALKQYQWENIKPQVDHIIFPDGKRIILLAEGRLVNLGCATGHPSYVMCSSFANQTLAQIELFTQPRTSTRSASTSCRRSWTRRWRACSSRP